MLIQLELGSEVFEGKRCRLIRGNGSFAQEILRVATPCLMLIAIEQYSRSPFVDTWAYLRALAVTGCDFWEHFVKPSLSVGAQVCMFLIFEIPASSVLVLGEFLCPQFDLDLSQI